MNPEIEALINVYQKRLSEVTAQAIAFEARIQVLQLQIQQIQQMQTDNNAPVNQQNSKRSVKKSAVSDAGEF